MSKFCKNIGKEKTMIKKIMDKFFVKKVYTIAGMILMVYLTAIVIIALTIWLEKKHKDENPGDIRVENVKFLDNCKVIESNVKKRKRRIKSCIDEGRYVENCKSIVNDIYPDKRKCKIIKFKIVKRWGGDRLPKWTRCNEVKDKDLIKACEEK